MNRLFPILLSATMAAAETPLLPPQVPPPPSFTPPKAPPGSLPTNEVIPDWQARWEMAQALSYLKRYDEALAEYRRVLAEQPANVAVRADYGQVLLWSGQPEAAITELSRIPPEQLPAAAGVALADALRAQGRFADAEERYRTQLQRDRGDQLTRFKLAELLSWNKRYEESLALYREILAALPDDVQVRRHYAQTLLWAGRADESAAELRRTLPE